MEYTWIKGAFFLREDKGKRWKHLSFFPELYERETMMHNIECTEKANAISWATCDESEGWWLHKSWHGGIHSIAPPPKGFALLYTLLSFYVTAGFREGGLKGLLFGLYWFFRYEVLKR